MLVSSYFPRLKNRQKLGSGKISVSVLYIVGSARGQVLLDSKNHRKLGLRIGLG